MEPSGAPAKVPGDPEPKMDFCCCVVPGGSSLINSCWSKPEPDSGFFSAEAAVAAAGLPNREPESLAVESLADEPAPRLNPVGWAVEAAGFEPPNENPEDGVPKENLKPAEVELPSVAGVSSAFCGAPNLNPPGGVANLNPPASVVPAADPNLKPPPVARTVLLSS